MDFRNVLMAIVLSSVVLIGWATFFEPPIVEQQTTEKQITKPKKGEKKEALKTLKDFLI